MFVNVESLTLFHWAVSNQKIHARLLLKKILPHLTALHTLFQPERTYFASGVLEKCDNVQNWKLRGKDMKMHKMMKLHG